MRDEIMQDLYKTFNLSTRQGTGGMTFKYVPNEDVITRMNKVFKGNWSTVVKHKDIIEEQVLVEVQVTITDPDSQEIYTQTGFGSSQIARYNSGPNQGKVIDIGNAYKGSLSKAIVNACTRWGVGLIKERDAYNEEEVTTVSDPAIPSIPPPVTPPAAPVVEAPAPAPVAPPNTAAAPMPVMPSTAAAPVAPTPEPVVVAPAPVVNVQPPAPEPAPVAETITTFPPPMTPDQPVSANIAVEQVAPEAPATPLPATAGMPATPDLPFSKDEGLAGVVISDVQKVALNGILTMNNADYGELAQEAFTANGINKPVPIKEDLSYEEAVVVIKFGNEKYRKNR